MSLGFISFVRSVFMKITFFLLLQYIVFFLIINQVWNSAFPVIFHKTNHQSKKKKRIHNFIQGN